MRKTSATEGRRYRALAGSEEHADAYVRRFVWAGTGTDGWLMLMELSVTDPGGPNESMTTLRKYTWGLDLAGQSGAGVGQGSALSAASGGLQAAGDVPAAAAILDRFLHKAECS